MIFSLNETLEGLAKMEQKGIDGCRLGLNLKQDGIVIFVANPAGNTVFFGEGTGSGAKADTLHPTAESDFPPHHA